LIGDNQIMKLMLDTNICVFLINGRNPSLAKRVSVIPHRQLSISSIVWHELMFGLEKSKYRSETQSRLQRFFSEIQILAFDDSAAAMGATVRAHLEQKGKPIGPLDTLIAGHALATQSTLVTNNQKEFKRVAGLVTADWT
jgi:tRNA(fMet)-specific endonuclease VapC